LSDRAVWKLLVQKIGGFAGFNQSLTIDSTGVVSCSGFRAPVSLIFQQRRSIC